MSKNKLKSILKRLISLEDYEMQYLTYIFTKGIIRSRWEKKGISNF